ncbi:response regulator transcription factor [Allomesorhizobium camelthorni]|uniref:Response regulator transcription factor n=1 Tax=Allomesorhizobium camelthorni TaxID=475069 RepID=A0A6G4WNL2_9HYPH|nr:response regulator transcription factor [Mesorhizobium camelthorni]NGO56169.1 response regulator transcription factor [Mesorhizobium camelthorni]
MSQTGPLVIIIDDDADTRDALCGLLETVKLRAVTFASATEFMASKRPDGPCCIVLDVRLPGLGGLEFQRRLTQENIPLPVIFITGHADVPMSVRAMKAGAVEFLSKPVNEQEFLDAVQTALERDSLRLETEREVAELRARHRSLTAREQQIMTSLVAGKVNKQIAAELAISEVTVRLHRLQVMRKMQIGSLAQLIRAADRIKDP